MRTEGWFFSGAYFEGILILSFFYYYAYISTLNYFGLCLSAIALWLLTLSLFKDKSKYYYSIINRLNQNLLNQK